MSGRCDECGEDRPLRHHDDLDLCEECTEVANQEWIGPTPYDPDDERAEEDSGVSMKGEVTVEYQRDECDQYPWRARTKVDGVWYAGDNLDHTLTRALRAWFSEEGGSPDVE